jgi:WhiB family redox-sensing transcriptional regulator
MPTDWWFVDTAKPDAYAAARGVCEACPVRQECLSYALEANERYGMWGGLSQDQRIKLKHRQALEAARRLA